MIIPLILFLSTNYVLSGFLLQAFYYEGKAIMSNEEFDLLKEELMWEGSSVVMLSTDLISIWSLIPYIREKHCYCL